MKLFFTCHIGAEKTRDDLRKQVYDAMAEEEKSGAADTKLESQAGKGNAEVKKENGVAKSPVKPDVNGSEEPSSDQKAKVNGVGESPAGSPGKETLIKTVDSKEQNGKETSSKPEEGKDDEAKPEADQDDEEAEGSRSLDAEHCLCGGWSTSLLILDIKQATLTGVTKGEGKCTGARVYCTLGGKHFFLFL